VKLTYSQLGKRLASGKLPAAYILSGNQDLLREQALKEIRDAALDESFADFNLDRFDGEKATAEAVVMAANMLPMMGSRRVVVVRRAKRLVEGAESETLIGYLENPCPQTLLVMELESSPDGRRKAWKQIEKLTEVVQCDELKEWQVEDWVAEQARLRQLSLGAEEIRYLASEFGSDLRRQINELEKLSLYAGKDKLRVPDIATLLGRGKAQSIFKFTDAVASRQTADALRQLGRLLEEGEPPLRILALLDRTLGHLLVAKELQGKRARSGEVMKVLRIPPRAAENLLRRARLYEESELLDAMAALAWCDRQLKGSGTPAALILEGFVVSLCGADGRSQGGRNGARKELSPALNSRR
jgi:DNA polymerase-3 subunit delta